MNKPPYVVKKEAGFTNLWRKGSPLISHLDMELTERCNLNCIHCYINRPAGDQETKSREISTSQIKAILQEAAGLGCLTVRFTGGEPLLRDDFEELYLYARRLGLKVLVFSNATLITSRLADLFARVPPLQKLEISVYGMSPKSYDAVTRVKGSYQAARRGIQLLLEKQVLFVVKSALLPPNAAEIKAFESWAATLPGMDQPPSYALLLDLRARRDSEEKNNLIRSLRPEPGEHLPYEQRDPDAYRKEMAVFFAKFIGPPGSLLFSCDAGHSACVDAYGKVQLCMLLRHPETVYDLGRSSNISKKYYNESERKKRTLSNALRNFFPTLLNMRATNPDYLRRCARCFLKGFCEQCPAKSWMEHGTLDTPVEYLCQVAHAQAKDLDLLKKDEHAWEVINWKDRVRKMRQESDEL